MLSDDELDKAIVNHIKIHPLNTSISSIIYQLKLPLSDVTRVKEALNRILTSSQLL
mgnify:CR=1 FL=1